MELPREFKDTHKKLLLSALLAFGAIFLLPSKVHAGMFELSAGGSLTSSDYGDGNFEWTRKWGASFGYHFSELSEIEFAFQDIVDVTNIVGFETTTFHDEIYSIDWVQALTSKNFPIQPYLKLGVGQLHREASGTYELVIAPPTIEDEFTVIAGAGLRIFLTQHFALRGEATAYLVGGSISTWKQNYALTAGLSWFF